MDTAVSVELFVEILNRYVYYFDQQNEQVDTPTYPPRAWLETKHADIFVAGHD